MNSSGHPFGPGPTATISEASPRADAWRTIFGGLTAPIKTAVPQRCGIMGTVVLVYWLDISRIDSETMDRLIAYTQAQRAGTMSYGQVHEAVMGEGMPIMADDVSTVTNEHPEMLIAGIDAEIANVTGMSAHHAALDAVLSGIADRMDAQAGVPMGMLRACEANPRATFAIPTGSSIGDTPINPERMTAQQLADIIGGDVIDERTIRGPSLAIGSSPGRIVYGVVLEPSATIGNGDVVSPEDVRAEALRHIDIVSHEDVEHEDGFKVRGIDDAPPLCSCLTDGTLLGPHCVHARAWIFRQEDGTQRVRKHGGAPTCPRACVECPEGAHHFSEIDMQPVYPLDASDESLDEDEREEVEALRKHPAHVAGCESWYECRHCDAWMEAGDDDFDVDDDEDEEEDDDSPDSDDFDDDGPDSDDFDDDDDWDDEDDEPNGEPTARIRVVPDEQLALPLSSAPDVSSLLPSNDERTNNQQNVRPVSVPRWASELASDLLFVARFHGFVGIRVPNNITAQWAPVIATWPNDVQASVHEWLGPQTAERPNGPTRDNAPAAVRALVDQANGGEA